MFSDQTAKTAFNYFQQHFNYIMVVSFIDGENHRPADSL